MVEFMRGHSETGALGCKMRYANGEVQEQGLQHFPTPLWQLLSSLFLTTETWNCFRSFLPYLDPHQSAYVKKLYGGCLLCRKTLLDEVGWFDERYFMYAEDVDLCQTILNRGYKLYYLAEAEIIHIAGGSSKKAASGFAILMKSESCCKLMRKYYGPFGAATYRFSTILGAVFRMALLLLVGVFGFVPAVRRRLHLGTSLAKQWLALRWALGLVKAQVAQSRPAAVQLQPAKA
jgi:GT2 family glycosyltransferase